MKRVTFVRHGKSSWDYNTTDKFRPLSQKGLNDVPLVAEAFKKTHVMVDAVLCSPASRALSTCCIFMELLAFPCQILSVREELYDFSGEKVKQIVKSALKKWNSIMIFGHNNALTNAVNYFGDRHLNNLPTTGLASIEMAIDEKNNLINGVTKFTITPKKLK